VIAARKKEIELNKTIFKWIPKPESPEDVGWGLPRYVDAKTYDDLPSIFHRTTIRKEFLKISKLEGGINAAVATINGMLIVTQEDRKVHRKDLDRR